MKRMPFILVSLLLLFWATACGWLTGPDDEVVDPRNYTWTVDTLAYPGSSRPTALGFLFDEFEP